MDLLVEFLIYWMKFSEFSIIYIAYNHRAISQMKHEKFTMKQISLKIHGKFCWKLFSREKLLGKQHIATEKRKLLIHLVKINV